MPICASCPILCDRVADWLSGGRLNIWNQLCSVRSLIGPSEGPGTSDVSDDHNSKCDPDVMLELLGVAKCMCGIVKV